MAIYASRPHTTRTQPARYAWPAWLVVVAWFPDLDYAVPVLRSVAHGGARITHSLAFALMLPALTCATLAIAGVRGRRWTHLALQVTGAGVSHLLLDFLVGVTPLALFWPITDTGVVSPIGLLPSAGTPNLRNPYFLRNLAIELGALVPLLAYMQLRRRTKHPALALGLLVCSIAFMGIAASLPR